MLQSATHLIFTQVSDLWKLEDEIHGQPPSRPPAPRNYIVDMNRDGRNRGQLVANSSYRPGPKYAEVRRVAMPPQRGPVEEPVSVSRVDNHVEAAPNGYDDYDAYKRPPAPRDYRPPADRYDDRPSQYRPPPSRNERPPPREERPPPVRNDRPPPRDERPPPARIDRPPPREERGPPVRNERPPPQNYRDPPPSYDAPRQSSRYGQDRASKDEPKREPYRDYSTGPMKPSNYRDRPIRDEVDSQRRPPPSS